MAKKRDIVVESNALIESRYSLTLIELKLFLLVISQIDSRKDNDFKIYRVYYNEFLNKAQLEGRNRHTHTRRACKSLTSKRVYIQKASGGEIFTHFFADAETFPKAPYIEITIPVKLKPYLLKLNERFTQYDLRNILMCKSVYSVRVYQLLKQHQKLKERTFEISELKKILGMKPNQYKQFINFRMRVLEPARKELKKHSDIYFSYRGNRKGRAFHSLTFIIKRKNPKQKRRNPAPENKPNVLSYEKVMETLNAPTAPPYTPDP